MASIRLRLVAFGIATFAATFTLGPAATADPDAAVSRAIPIYSADDDKCSPTVERFVPDTPSGIISLQGEQSWKLATGEGITVAIVDSGVSYLNVHLGETSVLPGANLVGDGEDPTGRSDITGHGTAIAGLIAARQVESSGVIGLAPQAKILPVRVFRSEDEESRKAGFGPSIGRMAEGIRYAVDHGATIINVSMSDSADSPVLRDAVTYAYERGSLVVASAGNRNTAEDAVDGLRYPAAYPEVLGVTAVDSKDNVTDASIHGEQVDVAAPGANVLTTYFSMGDCIFATEAAQSSFATGYASAAAALLAQRFPEEGPAGWIYRLSATAARASADNRTDIDGWGLIQPYEALTFINDGSARGPVNPFYEKVERVEATPAPINLSQRQSPMVPTQNVALWAAALGVTATVVIVLLRRRSQ